MRFSDRQPTVLRRPPRRPTIADALLRMAEQAGACPPGRGQRVAAAAVLLGRHIGMRAGRLAALAEAGLLLDIGLTGMPLHVAQRSRPLTEDEEPEFQLHPMHGLDVARDFVLGIETLGGIIHHHERYDGRGYPMGLVGREIPEFARILAIADGYDDLTRSRSGDVKLAAEEALPLLRARAGTEFDPEFVNVFSSVVAERGLPDRGGLRGDA